MSIEELLARGQAEIWIPAVSGLSQHLAQPEKDVELVLITVGSTIVIMWLVGLVGNTLFGSGNSRSAPACCVTRFCEQRRAKRAGIVQIPAGTGGSEQTSDNSAVLGFLQELYGQLGAIQKEISILKHERELMDAELIETSTQILQTLGASFIGAMPGDESLISRDGSIGTTPDSSTRRKIELPTPLMHKPQVVRPEPVHPQPRSPKAASHVVLPQPQPKSPRAASMSQVAPSAPAVKAPQPRSPISAPVAHTSQAAPTVVVPPKAFPKSDSSPVNAPVLVHPKPIPQQPPSHSPKAHASSPPPGQPKVEPKLSALAAARLKREAELNAAKAPTNAPVPQQTVAATNPFAAKAKQGAPPSGPFQRLPLT